MKALPLVFLTMLIAAPIQAQEAVSPPDLPPGEDRIESVSQGRLAPFTGMLLDTDTAIRWTNRMIWWRETFQLRLREHTQILDALRSSHTRELTLMQESYGREVTGLREDLRASTERYEQELARYRDPPFYEQWGFAFGMGALAMGIVVGVIGGLLIGL